jgi:hypothetical protein
MWLAAEQSEPGTYDPADDLTDAIVTLADGTRWVASFCSYAHVDTLRRHLAASGDCLGGRYLWLSDLILIKDTSRATIEAVTRDLLRTGAFRSAFDQCPPLDLEDAV